MSASPQNSLDTTTDAVTGRQTITNPDGSTIDLTDGSSALTFIIRTSPQGPTHFLNYDPILPTNVNVPLPG